VVDVELGLKPGEPVFVLPDLSPHVDKEQRKRTADEVFKGEELNVVAGSLPNAKGNVQAAFMELLKSRYGLHEEDFVPPSSRWVPAQEPREVG
jgi:aspartyl aminopeptidase